MTERSRIFWLNRKPQAQPRGNEATQFLSVLPLELGRHAPGGHIEGVYREALDFVEQCTPPGLAVVAASAGSIQAKAYLSARSEGINTAVIGRHSLAEVFLPRDAAISLRHMAILVHPSASTDEVRFRLLDLRTPCGFRDARGAVRRAVESGAPYLAGCGDYALLFAPVTSPAPRWPEAPERLADAFHGDVLTNPETVERLRLGPAEEPVGELVVSSSEGSGSVVVSRRALRSGILLGRSDRCDGGGLLSDPHISRVHLLIIEIAGVLYAIDTASKNGVSGASSSERATLLESGAPLSLAGRALVEWRFFH